MTRMRIALTIGLIVSGGTRARAEDITVSTYYPSPRGVYQQLRTTNNTFLATLAGNVGIGMEAPGSRLVVQGAGATNATSSLNVTNNAAASMFFVRDDGNVGIGTAAPGYSLEVNGTARLGASAAGAVHIKTGGASLGIIRPAVSNGSLLISDDSELATRGLTIANGGSVGIGTAAPAANSKLHIVGANSVLLRITPTGGNNTFRIDNLLGNRSLSFDVSAGGGGWLGLWADDGATKKVQFVGSGTDGGVNYINSGPVGIGTVNPGVGLKLDVQGKIGGTLDGGANNGELKVNCPGDGNCYAVYGPP